MSITYILQVTLCLGIFYAFYHVALQKETLFQTNRVYLLTTLLMSLVLPLIRIYFENQQHESSIITAPSVYVGSYLTAVNESITVTPQQKSIPWLYILKLIYLAGVLMTGFRFIGEIGAILSIKRKGEKAMIAGQLCILSADIKSPFSFFNTIYLPVDHQFNEHELDEIIAHEKAHVISMHTLDILFMEMVCILLWLSPMVYVYRKKLKEVHEFLADAEVLKNTPWENYASFLVSQKGTGLQNQLSNQMFYSQLKNRLIMMNKQRSFRSANLKYFGIIPILLMALVVFSFREKSLPDKGGDPRIVLTVTHDKKYSLDGKEIPFEQLEQSLTERIKDNPERKVYVSIDSTMTGEDLDKVMSLGKKFNIIFILESNDHHPDHTDLAQFLIVVEKTDNELKLTCKDGCAWKSLTFNSSAFDEPQAIDQNGMTTVSSTYPVNDPEHPNFLFTIKGEGNGVNLIGIEGTAWTKLSFARPKSLWMQAIDQFGMTTIDEEGHSTSVAHLHYYPQDTLPATVVTAYRFTEPSAAVDGSKEYKPDSDIYDDMAIFPGCEDLPISQRGMCGQTNLMRYINSHLIYPESLKKSGIEGKVFIRFTVGINGYIKNIVIEKSLNPDADDAVLNVFKNMNKEAGRWLPARKGGKTMEAEMTLPVSFSLGAAEEKTVWDEPYMQVEQMPRFPGCEEFTKTIKSSDISIGDFSIPRGSVKVTSGGQELKENEDYSIDYNTGRIKILNQAFMQPDTPINVSFKNDDKTNCANEAMFKYIYSAIKYPQEDREIGNEGMVIAQFTVSADGNISNIKVVRGVSPGLDAEIVRVINGMNDLPEKWTPGKHNGNAVPVQLTLPFKFVLQQKDITQDEESSKDEVFTYVEEMPSFPEGVEAMYKYIYQNIKYPEKAFESEISGQVIVQFVVSEEGDIQKVKVIRGIGGGCDEEALRVVNGMPRWQPGKNDGKAVPVSFTLPIKFVLHPDPSNEKSQGKNSISNDKMNEAPVDQKIEVLREIPLLLIRCPNPVNDILKVEFFSWVKNVSIFNESGQLMWSKKLDDNEHLISVDVNKWAAGQYVIQGVRGQESRTTAFVVQH